jgi:hypothetical protein
MKIEYNQESFHKELEMIQACITRMGHNSFLVKGWLLSIVAASMALLPESFNGWFVIGFLVLVTVAFWYLDGFFLFTERLYRHKYDWVIKARYEGNKEHAFNLNPHKSEMRLKGVEIGSVKKVMFSKTLNAFYGVIFGVLVILLIAYPFVEDLL